MDLEGSYLELRPQWVSRLKKKVMVCIAVGALLQVLERLNIIQEVQLEWLIHAFEGLSVGSHKAEVYSTVKKSHLIKLVSPLSSHDVTDRISQECVLVNIASIAIIDIVTDKKNKKLYWSLRVNSQAIKQKKTTL